MPREIRWLALVLGCVLPSGVVRLQEQATPQPVVVTGRLVDPTGQPIPDGVAQNLEPNGVPAGRAGCDADGVFHLDLPNPTGSYRIEVAAPGRARWTLTPSSRLRPGERLVDVGEIALMDGVTLAGRVRTADGGAIAGAEVEVEDLLPAGYVKGLPRRARGGHGTTNAAGIFSLDGVPSSGLAVTVRAPGYVPVRRAPVDRQTPLEFRLQPAVPVAGQMPSRAAVCIVHENGLVEPMTLAPHEGGGFTFSGWARPGLRYRVRAQGSRENGVSLSTWSAVLEGRQDDVVLGELGGAPATGSGGGDRAVDGRPDDEAEPTGWTLTVLGPGGAPVHPCSVAAAWSTPPSDLPSRLCRRHGDTFEGVDGAVTIPYRAGAVGGTWVVRAPGCARRFVQIGAPGVAQSITLESERVVTGRVLDSSGEPVKGCRVWALPTDSRFGTYGHVPPSSVATDGDGRYRLVGLAAGPHGIQVAPPHGDPRRALAPLVVDLGAAGKQGAVPDLNHVLSDGCSIEWKAMGAWGGSGPVGLSPGWALVLEPVLPFELGAAVWSGQRLQCVQPCWSAGREGRLLVSRGPTTMVLTGFAPGRVPFVREHELPLSELDRDLRVDPATWLDAAAVGRVEGLFQVDPFLRTRLLVVALTGSRSSADDDPPAVLLGSDGRWAMDLPAGDWTFGLRDLATGLDLWLDDGGVDVRVGETIPDLERTPALGVVRVSIEPPEGRGRTGCKSLRVFTNSGRRRMCELPLWDVELDQPLVLLLPPGNARLTLLRPAQPVGDDFRIARRVLEDTVLVEAGADVEWVLRDYEEGR